MSTNKTEEQKYSFVREYYDSVSAMIFVMPSAYTKENLPKPNDYNIQINNTSEEYVTVIRFPGYNPPFQFIGKRNKIIVAFDRKEKQVTGEL